MLTYNERIELRDKLINGEIGIKDALAQYWRDVKEGDRSWHTKDWNERRANFIKDKCQICNGNDTLTLQHLSHPRKYSEYLAEIRRTYAKDYIRENPEIDKSEFYNHVIKEYHYVPTPLCSNCKSSNPKERVRKLPQYRCTACKHEFDKPVYRSVDELISKFYEDEQALEVQDKCFVSKKWKNEHSLSNVRYWLQRERSTKKDDIAIEKEAFLLYLIDDIKYLSFEDTITACRKCAYMFDMQKMELCPKCKVDYKSIQYPTCIQCLPEEHRKVVLEKIEFAKEWEAMHKELGID